MAVTQHAQNIESILNTQVSGGVNDLIGTEDQEELGHKHGKCPAKCRLSEWHMIRSRKCTMYDTSGETDIVEVYDVVNTISEPDPRNYGEAMKSSRKGKWVMAIDEDLTALEAHGV